MLNVREEFVREAYDSACAEWKDKIKNEFPILFSVDEIKNLKEYKTFIMEAFERSFWYNDKYIAIELPKANDSWTNSAFRLALRISEMGIAQPRHGYYKDNFLKTISAGEIIFSDGDIKPLNGQEFILLVREW